MKLSSAGRRPAPAPRGVGQGGQLPMRGVAALSPVGDHCPSGRRLFLLPSWLNGPGRGARRGQRRALSKDEIALDLVDQAREEGLLGAWSWSVRFPGRSASEGWLGITSGCPPRWPACILSRLFLMLARITFPFHYS